MEPVIAYALFNSLTHLRNACRVFLTRCVEGITANREHLRRMVENSIGIVTALNPYIGYDQSAAIAKEALASGRGVVELVLERGPAHREQVTRFSIQSTWSPRAGSQRAAMRNVLS